MKRSARIVDPYLQWREPSPAADFLLDNNDFLVVGIIGQQGVGKSSLMSLLGGNSWRDKRFHFRPQGFEAKVRFDWKFMIGIMLKTIGERSSHDEWG